MRPSMITYVFTYNIKWCKIWRVLVMMFREWYTLCLENEGVFTVILWLYNNVKMHYKHQSNRIVLTTKSNQSGSLSILLFTDSPWGSILTFAVISLDVIQQNIKLHWSTLLIFARSHLHYISETEPSLHNITEWHGYCQYYRTCYGYMAYHVMIFSGAAVSHIRRYEPQG